MSADPNDWVRVTAGSGISPPACDLPAASVGELSHARYAGRYIFYFHLRGTFPPITRRPSP